MFTTTYETAIVRLVPMHSVRRGLALNFSIFC
ncbi:hypothetical protein PybrP1_011402 [[Pythium] brassicae (nom. inval.)]|nr:hypothetical protein PybrP1_011402 [[Pythium] brassicae (nom. inval.)]